MALWVQRKKLWMRSDGSSFNVTTATLFFQFVSTPETNHLPEIYKLWLLPISDCGARQPSSLSPVLHGTEGSRLYLRCFANPPLPQRNHGSSVILP